jgi:uncharacterized protein
MDCARSVAELTPEDVLGRTRLLILQGTPFCNISCRYCYLPNRNDRSSMSLRTLRSSFEWIVTNGLAANSVSVFWHCGEPLTLGPGWYNRAIAEANIVVSGSVRLEHRLQTNGILISDEWCDFFAAHDFKIGVSLDGPPWLHDANRRSRNDRGTHAETMRGIRALQRYKIPFHVICVVTSNTLGAPDELAEFFIAEGIHNIGFNVEEIEGVNNVSSLSQSKDAKGDFTKFLSCFLDRAEDSGALRVRELVALINWLRSPNFSLAKGNEQNTPFEIITITHRGDIATFSPELVGLDSVQFGDFTIGNVNRDSLNDVLTSERFRTLWREIASGVAACSAECGYFKLCRGGAPANKFGEHRKFSTTDTLFCRLAEQAVADVVLPRLEGLWSRAGQST